MISDVVAGLDLYYCNTDPAQPVTTADEELL